MLHYYFLLSLEKEIPQQIKNKIDIDDSFRYASASFLNLGNYYKALNILKKDKYCISQKLHDEKYFFPFIYDSLIYAKYKNDYEYLYFIYGCIATYSIDKYIYDYIDSFKTKKFNKYKIENMITYYIAFKNSKLDLSKQNLTKIFDYDKLYDEKIHKFVNKPIQKNLKFFACKNYFLKSAKVKNFIDKYYTKNNFLYFTSYFIDMLRLNRKNKKRIKDYKYKSKINTSVLNLHHLPIMVNNMETNDSIEDVINKAYSYAKSLIKAVNNLVFFNNKKDFCEISGLNNDMVYIEETTSNDEEEKIGSN